ncbi:MAG: TrmO family methyltransferase, partial [Phycisphaerae bacterium]|nr:TrmO family methyltransferase [Phycisphaerae bacterium]
MKKDRTPDLLFSFQPIGIIRSPFSEASGTPIQPVYGKGVEGEIELYPDFKTALKDIDGFERIWLIYLFHRASPFKPLVVPFKDDAERGLFATRAPCRPNPIGLSAVRL